jgi:hypothetical protein
VAASYARGERPDPREYLTRAGAGADELGRLVESWLLAAPVIEGAVMTWATFANLQSRWRVTGAEPETVEFEGFELTEVTVTSASEDLRLELCARGNVTLGFFPDEPQNPEERPSRRRILVPAAAQLEAEFLGDEDDPDHRNGRVWSVAMGSLDPVKRKRRQRTS